MIKKNDWLLLTDREVAAHAQERVSTTLLLINGTRRWFLAQGADWSQYAEATGAAHRRVSQLLYDHGISTLVQPLLGFDLLERGEEYVELAIRQALVVLADQLYTDWYARYGIRVRFYGKWQDTLRSLGYHDVLAKLTTVTRATEKHERRYLLIGLFADRPLDDIVSLAKLCHNGQELIERYYGLPRASIDLIIGSGQPAIWDVPLLDFNRANLYFLKSPTFFLTRESLRQILYDHLFERVPDDNVTSLGSQSQDWELDAVLGIGKRTSLGWIAL
jgi:hypothetical protein